MTTTMTTEDMPIRLGSVADPAPRGDRRPRAVLYLRSAGVGPLDRNGDNAQLRRQREVCQMLAARLRLRVIAEFSDLGVSGKQMDRRGLNALLERTRLGDIEVVVTENLARLAGIPADMTAIEQQLARHGVRVAHAGRFTAARRESA